MRGGVVLFSGALRAMTPAGVLQTVRADPGMTTTYYCNRYYGKENFMQLNHVLWSVLKRGGKVDIDRADGQDAPPRWYPLFSSPRRHQVRAHDPAEEDLSLLRAAPPTAPEAPPMPSDAAVDSAQSLQLESAIVGLVHSSPGRDIHYYIMELPLSFQRGAPAAFKRLRLAGLLEREATATGTFVWR